MRQGITETKWNGDNLIRNPEYWARVTPDKTAVVIDGKSLTWREIDEQANRYANGLIAGGFGHGDRVGLLMRNRLDFAVALYGTMKAGGGNVLLNIRYTPDEIRHPITDSGLRVIIADADLLPLLVGIEDYAPAVEIVTSTPVEGYRQFSDLLADDASAPDVRVVGEDIAMVCYTSGTTGLPKGAAMSHQAIFSAYVARANLLRWRDDDRMLVPMPMAYTAGSVFFIRDSLQSGTTFYYMSKPTGDNMLELIEQDRITMAESVAVLWEMMMASPRFDAADVSSLRYASCGGQYVSMELLRRWQGRGVALAQGYGQTETVGSHITMLMPEDSLSKIGFAGRAMPNLDVRVMREDGTEASPHESGEIWVRGASVMTCYLNRPEETAAALEGGWLHTGDVGLMDEDGYLKIVDRTKDMLISGGLNVYPAEIEKILGGIKGLEEVAVIGVRDAKWGEIPILITPNLAEVDIDGLKALCREKLADFKRPKYAIHHPEPLPRTFSGKITKQPLRKQYVAVPEGAVAL